MRLVIETACRHRLASKPFIAFSTIYT